MARASTREAPQSLLRAEAKLSLRTNKAKSAWVGWLRFASNRLWTCEQTALRRPCTAWLCGSKTQGGIRSSLRFLAHPLAGLTSLRPSVETLEGRGYGLAPTGQGVGLGPSISGRLKTGTMR